MWPLQSYSPISWGPEDRALILGAFFYGYVVFQVAAVKEEALTKIRCLGVEWPRCTEQRRCLDTGLAHNMWMDIFVSEETQLCNHHQTDDQHVDDKLAGPPHPPGRLHQHLGHLCPPGCPGRHCLCVIVVVVIILLNMKSWLWSVGSVWRGHISFVEPAHLSMGSPSRAD